jgi:LacI family transcriptional regulator/LacI family repressor for deo operon, udp, cdd, tsx, nupC, and nupG
MPTSIKDLAKKLNLSVSTVSYAINGGPRSVSPEVTERVLEAARELGYRPNRIAKSMVTGRSRTIGVVPPEIVQDVLLSPYLQLALNGIFNSAGTSDHDLVLYTRLANSNRDVVLSTILDGRVDGAVFIAPNNSQEAVMVAQEMRIPCVSIAGTPIEGVHSLSIENRAGMRLAMEHLLDQGHRRIGHIAGRLDMQDAIERLDAFSECLLEHGLTLDTSLVAVGQFHPDGGYEAMKQLLSLPKPPTAVVSANDDMAIGALRACQERAVRVPQDISICGFDMTTISSLTTPPLTTVHQPITEMGWQAVQDVIKLIEGQLVPQHITFQPTLVVRSSTTFPTKEL